MMEITMATIASPGTRQETFDREAPLYNVVLLDDAEHTYDYVIEMLEKLFALSSADAWNRAVEVDTIGRTIVITCELQAAEFGRDQIHAFGADWRMPNSKGSMSAIVEPCQT
jgi:ATP-dependent Clp protease adaptor protein ClpS